MLQGCNVNKIYIPNGIVAFISHDVTIMLHKPKGYVQWDITTMNYPRNNVSRMSNNVAQWIASRHHPQEKCMKAIPGGRGVVFFRGNTP